MRTNLCLATLVAFCLATSVRAQTNTPPARPGDNKITLDKMAAVSSNPIGVDTNVVSLLSFDSELPLKTAIETLANQANLKFRYAPELMPDGKPAAVLNASVGAARFEQMTAFEALQRLLSKNDLVLGRYAAGGNQDVIIGTKESKLTPIGAAAPAGGDLAANPADTDFEVFASGNEEIPLQTAILMLARFAKIPVVLDPRLKTGGERFVGAGATNVVTLPAITNITVNLSSMAGLSAKQRLLAILKVHDLDMVADPASQVYTISYKEPGAKEPLVPNVIPLRYSNTTNIVSLLQAVFPPPTRIQADTRTASLLVISTAKDFDSITNLIAQLDTPTKQVLIEARFIDTLLNPESFKGVNWTDTLKNNRVTFGNGNSANQNGTTAAYQNPVGINPDGVLEPDRIVNGFTLNTASGFSPSTAFLNSQGVSALLSFLNQDADTRTLSTPRAVTLDNQETHLQVTRAIPIFNQSEGIGQAGVTVSSSTPSYTNVGTILIVTPRISGTNVQMHLEPEISDTELQLSTKTVAGKVNQADIFTMQKIDTKVMIPSGNTLVMGGLSQDISNRGYTKVPVLGDIPVLGWAFRSESIQRKKRNIFIFVTPTIIEDEDYQPYRTDFLNTKMPEHPELGDDPMHSAKPKKWDYDTTKPRKATKSMGTDGAPGFE